MIFGAIKGLSWSESKQFAQDIIKHLQLNDVGNKPVGTFSGGMKRRISVSLAFIGHSKVVFLDEPTTGLDPVIKKEVWELVIRLKNNRIVIMTTHVNPTHQGYGRG